MKQMIYLDNAATSFPKPGEYLKRALDLYLQKGASPGRGSYDLAVEAEDMVNSVRRRLCYFFGGDETYHTCFTYNATEALNIVIQGMIEPGCHVVSSLLEHNSVLRPLHHLSKKGMIRFDLVPFDMKGFIDPESIRAAIKPGTKLVILNHASNVLGTIQPAEEIGRICREKGVPLVLDVSQSAGVVPVDMKSWGVDGVAFTGHKSLLGPTGIGGLILSPDVDPEPSKYGGTGVDSSLPYHPMEYPSRLEAGTVNLLGILSLDASLDFLHGFDKDTLYKREMSMLKQLRDGLRKVKGIKLYCVDQLDDHIPLLTCTVEGHDSEDVGAILDGDFGIAVRAGLHCAPFVHKRLGTMEKGAVRFSPGPFNTESEIDEAIYAMSAIAGY